MRPDHNYPAGQQHHRARYSNALVESARQMHDDGASRREIARALGVPDNTVRDWLDYRTRVYG